MLIRPYHIGSIVDLARGAHWSPEVLQQEVERRANELAHRGCGRGSIVLINHGETASFFSDLLATWRVGACAACVDPTLSESERAVIFQFVQPALTLAGDVCALGKNSDLGITPGVAHDAAPDDPALILFTSGTTGAPKGVVLSFAALRARIEINAAKIGRKVLARTLVTLPTHFGHGLIGNALTPLLTGGQIVLHPLGLPLAQNFASAVDEHEITFLSSVPAFWRVAMKVSKPPSRGTLLRVHVGSAPLSKVLWSSIAKWTNAEVVNCYGMTEAANWIACASSSGAIQDGMVGQCWGGAAAVFGDDQVRRFVGEGEIIVRSPALMTGYLHRPDLTAAALRDGWLHTGDRGTIDADGTIRLTGRIKDEINRAGLKVQPAEIDMLLETHPAVAEACTFPLDDAISGEIVAAAVRFAPGAITDVNSLRIWCRERLRREAIPERWFVVEHIARTPRGKINRDAVRRQLAGVAAIT